MLHDEANVPRSAFDIEPESSWVPCFFSLLSDALIGHFAYICALFFFFSLPWLCICRGGALEWKLLRMGTSYLLIFISGA